METSLKAFSSDTHGSLLHNNGNTTPLDKLSSCAGFGRKSKIGGRISIRELWDVFMVIKDSLYVIYDGHESQDKERETERFFYAWLKSSEQPRHTRKALADCSLVL